MRAIIVFLILIHTTLFSDNFTVASFNCGGLSDHYDYIRAVCMHKLVQDRYNEEPKLMARLEKIQKTALRKLFASSQAEKQAAEKRWNRGKYSEILKKITSHPSSENSINAGWREKSESIVTTYKERPIIVRDQKVKEMLYAHLQDLNLGQGVILHPESSLNDWLEIPLQVMAKRIFAHELRYDIIALQEADYLNETMFPKGYDVRFSDTSHSINGIAWNTERFELISVIGNIANRGFAVHLRDLNEGQTVVIASGHLSGCNPFEVETNDKGEPDAAKGDADLRLIIETLASVDADLQIIGMDSNVTATHPRLTILKEAGYRVDYTNYLEPTCTNPWQILDTRIDWITVKSGENTTLRNIPVLGIGLNSPQTNISDHKPIAASISY